MTPFDLEVIFLLLLGAHLACISSFSSRARGIQSGMTLDVRVRPGRDNELDASKWMLHAVGSDDENAKAPRKSLEEIKRQVNRNWDFDPTLPYEEQVSKNVGMHSIL